MPRPGPNPPVPDPRLGPIGAPRGDGSRAVAVGGGHGLARTLRALTHVVDHVTAIVTVADDGGSSGRLREEFDVIPPGDLRMALAALCGDPGLVRLLQHRFDRGAGLAGHALGNLVLLALHDIHDGDVVAALDELAALLRTPGRVLPCTVEPVVLRGRGTGGHLEGQARIATSRGVHEVWLHPTAPPATPEAVTAIERADLVVLGPGSLYTSIVPNLLVRGIAEALTNTAVPVVHVANLREQRGETEGMDLEAHVAALLAHVPGLRLDAVVVHDGPPPAGRGAPIAVRDPAPSSWGMVVARDLLDGHDGHAPRALAECFDVVLGRRPAG